MLKKAKSTANNIVAFAKKYLEKQEKNIEKQIDDLKKDDPFFLEDRVPSSESGTQVMEYEGHERITVVRNDLKKTLFQIKKALSRIGVGKYGKCERCGREIDPKRLKALPETTYCLKCETELEQLRKSA